MWSRLSLLSPPFSPYWTIALIVALGVLWCALRLGFGPTARLARHRGLIVLRSISIVILAIILFGNPVHVAQSPGALLKSDVFFLLDGSQSMSIGNPGSRWDAALQSVRDAQQQAGRNPTAANVQAFRFGQRLAALPELSSATTAQAEAKTPAVPAAPTDADSRIADALRQVSSRFGRRPPNSLVLISDGRTKNSLAVEEMARDYAARKLPIHVYPVGETTSSGDIALLALVAPERVRKYSTVEVQVFLRSFGYNGRRTEVHLEAVDGGQPEALAPPLPITLRGGVQSVTLSYRSDMRSREVRVRVPVQSDELSSRNNELLTPVQIERTKIRVLYLEGNDQPLTVVRKGDRNIYQGPHSELQAALSEDEDIECVALVLQGGGELFRVELNSGTRRGFPDSYAEMSAFDAIILSDIPQSILTDVQLRWIRQWVENRGGGLAMFGGGRSFQEGGWADSPVAEVLPVDFTRARWSAGAEVPLVPAPAQTQHALWQIVTDVAANREILAAIPPLAAAHEALVPKPTTDVLATSGGTHGDQPLLVTGNFGRGRTLALGVPAAGTWAANFQQNWGRAGNRYTGKFWRNAVYWLTENSSIGRCRLVPQADKRFYKPGETIRLSALAYDETARPTGNYRIWATLSPELDEGGDDSLRSPIRWPQGVIRESGESGSFVLYGEELELIRKPGGGYDLPLEIADVLRAGIQNAGLRIELTAYEHTPTDGSSHGTQVDSTTLQVQVIDDPIEQQNPFPDHALLEKVAQLSGGKVLTSPAELARVLADAPAEVGAAQRSQSPLWNAPWLWLLLVATLSAEWFWRRAVGMA